MTTTVMRSEIAEQPDAVAHTLDDLLPLRTQLRGLAKTRRHVLLLGRGSSDNACVYGRYLLAIHALRPTALASASIATHYHAHLDLSDTLLVSVSQSGATEEIIAAQRWAAGNGARTVAITNVAGSELAAEADLALVTRAGPEHAVPATKTYTTQLVAMAVLGTALADDSALDRDLRRVPDEIDRLLRSDVDAATERLARASEILVTARGLVFGTALETALKLEETCLSPVRGLSYADLRHGPIATIHNGSAAVLVAAPEGPTLPGMTELAGDLVARGAEVIGLGGPRSFTEACPVALCGPGLPEALAPLALVVPAQLTVEALARRLGLNPDAPRGLSKVTQTEPADAP